MENLKSSKLIDAREHLFDAQKLLESLGYNWTVTDSIQEIIEAIDFDIDEGE